MLSVEKYGNKPAETAYKGGRNINTLPTDNSPNLWSIYTVLDAPEGQSAVVEFGGHDAAAPRR